jgi:hypothetical protein
MTHLLSSPERSQNSFWINGTLKEISKDRMFDLKDERGEAIALAIAMGSNVLALHDGERVFHN